MDVTEKRIREIFADELERESEPNLAVRVRDGSDNSKGGVACVRAIRRALEEIPIRSSGRVAAYEALDSERAYQDYRWGATLSGGRPANSVAPAGHRSVDEFVLYIVGYANELGKIGATSNDTEEKLNFVRKVGGLAVACLEQHGAPRREGY